MNYEYWAQVANEGKGKTWREQIKKVGAAKDMFHHCSSFSWPAFGLGDSTEPTR